MAAGRVRGRAPATQARAPVGTAAGGGASAMAGESPRPRPYAATVPAPRLVVLEARGEGFVASLQRAWADGDAVLPLDPRLPGPARAAVLAAARPDEPV